jgi:hypothetical protein
MENINFCTLSEKELLSILDYLGYSELVQNSECEQKIKDKVCIEKRWRQYDEIVVTPQEIFFAPDPYPRRSVFTVEQYFKMIQLLGHHFAGKDLIIISTQDYDLYNICGIITIDQLETLIEAVKQKLIKKHQTKTYTQFTYQETNHQPGTVNYKFTYEPYSVKYKEKEIHYEGGVVWQSFNYDQFSELNNIGGIVKNIEL